MARPKKAISASQVESLAKIGCTVSEIAAVMNCDKRTLERRFAAVIQRGRERLKESLRRHQVKAATGGNVTMLIWLGKQYLGQKDRSEVEHIDVSQLTDEQLEAIVSGTVPSGIRAPAPGEGFVN